MLVLKLKNKKGFTLVEMMIAIGLFLVVVFIAIGAILSVFDANRRAQASRTIVDNLNFSIENMARTIRFGTNYHCDSAGTLSSPLNCPNNVVESPPGSSFLAVTFNGSVIVFRLNGTTIQRSDNGGSTYTNITPPEVKILQLRFYVFGATINDIIQPYVIAVINGYVGNKPTLQSSFFIETLMSQRKLDINI